MNIYDVAIVGAGPAGLSAALYCLRRKLKVIVITLDVGGQAILSGSVENYLGFISLSGVELINKFRSHIEKYPVEIKTGQLVDKIEQNKNRFTLSTLKGEKISSISVIITAGQSPRRLKIPGENEFEKKGVAYCATCDAPLFSNKPVAVVGGGNSALDSIQQLEKYASKVYSININPDYIGETARSEKVKKSPKVEIFFETETIKIIGKDFVESIEIKNKKTKKTSNIPVSGIFIEIGSIPASGFVSKLLKTNKRGEIIINQQNKTSINGIFAAGDITNTSYKQISVAVGEGAKAALSCAQYLSKK